MGAAIGCGGYFGRNLDAFADCLRGGFGTPEDGDFTVVWRAHEHSRTALGYPETVRQRRGTRRPRTHGLRLAHRDLRRRGARTAPVGVATSVPRGATHRRRTWDRTGDVCRAGRAAQTQTGRARGPSPGARSSTETARHQGR
ncbi:barstar family protein [Spirilliplanes yamanashiensis]|uniref:barstar family protein n=1 Tax=Spirilliplanes yamanashiensis TaxID=42233 RepID=UPI0035229995